MCCYPARLLSSVLAHELEELGPVGTAELFQALALAVKVEGGHGHDLVLGGNLLERIDIDLDKDDVRELGLERGNVGGNHLARAAPLGEKVNDDELVAVDELLELLGGLDHLDHCG